jgi:hypothetical protein
MILAASIAPAYVSRSEERAGRKGSGVALYTTTLQIWREEVKNNFVFFRFNKL